VLGDDACETIAGVGISGLRYFFRKSIRNLESFSKSLHLRLT
jgi:hypothetical protein